MQSKLIYEGRVNLKPTVAVSSLVLLSSVCAQVERVEQVGVVLGVEL